MIQRRHITVIGLSLTALAIFGACMDGGTKKPSSEEEKTFYALGLSIAERLESFDMKEKDIPFLFAGLKDGLTKKKPEVELSQYINKIQELSMKKMQAQAEEEKKAADEFLAKMAAEPGAEKLPSGVILINLKEGSGKNPSATDTVKVHYHGTLRDGKVFDSSVERKQPAEFPLNQVVPCWTEGVQKLKVGGKAKLGCPSAQAYGDRGAPPDIKPGAALQFEVELLEIVDSKKKKK